MFSPAPSPVRPHLTNRRKARLRLSIRKQASVFGSVSVNSFPASLNRCSRVFSSGLCDVFILLRRVTAHPNRADDLAVDDDWNSALQATAPGNASAETRPFFTWSSNTLLGRR